METLNHIKYKVLSMIQDTMRLVIVNALQDRNALDFRRAITLCM